MLGRDRLMEVEFDGAVTGVGAFDRSIRAPTSRSRVCQYCGSTNAVWTAAGGDE
ncbi:hypothetical protein [Rhodococcus rhodochrous]|uniref:hypothetical protein n=1 Tax=Rhodococcus rhodochrous TaxID=1829 RepID=UPI001D00F01A|nr:hypothetical protein [Rhodococcus rhodochrous]